MAARSTLFRKEGQFFSELIEGLVHEFPLCCVVEYCSDIYFEAQPKQAGERGVVFFRKFSLHQAKSLFNGLDRMWIPDHFVPCRKCKGRYEKMGKLVSIGASRNSNPH